MFPDASLIPWMLGCSASARLVFARMFEPVRPGTL
jgi:hypothetical protein